jgi:hypothetical protein
VDLEVKNRLYLENLEDLYYLVDLAVKNLENLEDLYCLVDLAVKHLVDQLDLGDPLVLVDLLRLLLLEDPWVLVLRLDQLDLEVKLLEDQ